VMRNYVFAVRKAYCIMFGAFRW